MDQPLLQKVKLSSTPQLRSRRLVLVLLTGTIVAIVMLIASLHNPFGSHMPLLGRPLKLRIYTHNIRFDNQGQLDKDETRWSHRKQGVIKSIDFNTATGYANIVNLQEVLVNQLHDVLAGLNENVVPGEEWTYYGVGRTDGKEKGEFAPILYKPSEWFLEHNETLWLSPTPEVPSKGWDAALERILTVVTLRLKENPLLVLNFFNTHFDHRGEVARSHLTKFIVSKLNKLNNFPLFLAGDLNTEPTDAPYGILSASGFHDSRVFVDPKHLYGENTTFTGFDRLKEENKIIDYIWSPPFAKAAGREANDETDSHDSLFGILLRRAGILSNYFRGEYISDHRPVVANFDVTRKIL